MKKIELLRYNNFLLKQIELTQKRVIKPIYRGDSMENLCEKLNVFYDQKEIDIPTLLERLFMVGEKAQRYYTNDENFKIDDAYDFVFENIMKYFTTSLKNKNKHTIAFFERNITLKIFFSDRNNKQLFLEKIGNATQRERIAIRNYYLTLLHQLASINYKKKSHLVSTSKDYKIAEKFAKEVILHCWQPIQMERNIIKKYKLPHYSVLPYDYQKELTIIGGILPHFISGLEIIKTKEFYPNPNIFINDITNEHFLNGLEIDQSNFDNIVNSTNYKITLETDGIDIWER
ncbi:hypothetical protein [Flavobacterium aquicola]|uniref:Uncharacterized protein n=1 Tax=Flavobacterium aquicola TaxID=1682742 RepID=A0A3E0DWA4_9FLAO|nr:hypothetical protein [Flavobacterium aquicola]REG88761.1 hypothetical protein C8P67_1281 [Flavobacterium aquicola]